jgi:GntR family transcriptional regulator/MocR family aminotransferase
MRHPALPNVRQVAGGSGRLPGLQLALWFTQADADDRALARQLQAEGLGVIALSPLFLGAARSGLLMGVATASPDVVRRFADALDAMMAV